MIVLLGTTNSAIAFSWFGGIPEVANTVPATTQYIDDYVKQLSDVRTIVTTPTVQSEPNPPKYKIQILDLIKQHLEMEKKQFEKTDKMYTSITGARENSESENSDNLYFQNPQSIYNKSRKSTLLKDKDITEEKIVFDSVGKARDSINQRSEYAAIVDKAVSLQTFKETENRFTKIKELLQKISQTKDLKSIAELQARLKGKLTMIQNEATKLQMVAYSRNIFANYVSDLAFDGKQNVGYALGGTLILSIISIILLLKLSQLANTLAKGVTFRHLWRLSTLGNNASPNSRTTK
ncbi:type IV secretion system protein [Bartonella alsatica]|nr:type IV secretion system protein [Bartonella alsatica]